MSIRSTAKALILADGKVLLNKCHDRRHGGYYYALPGGGQNKYEALHDAVIRECKEETGYNVNPLRLACVCEEINLNEEIREKYPDYAHRMYHVFLCELSSDQPGLPTEKDNNQISSEWIEICELNGIRLVPELIGNHIIDVLNGTAPVFLGSGYGIINYV